MNYCINCAVILHSITVRPVYLYFSSCTGLCQGPLHSRPGCLQSGVRLIHISSIILIFHQYFGIPDTLLSPNPSVLPLQYSSTAVPGCAGVRNSLHCTVHSVQAGETLTCLKLFNDARSPVTEVNSRMTPVHVLKLGHRGQQSDDTCTCVEVRSQRSTVGWHLYMCCS